MSSPTEPNLRTSDQRGRPGRSGRQEPGAPPSVPGKVPGSPPLPKEKLPSPPPLPRGEPEGGRGLLENCRGALLLETIIAAMVFSLVGVAVLAGLSTAYTSGSLTEEQSVAENVARNQMESIFAEVYREPQQTPYPTMSGIPTDYSVSTTVEFEDVVNLDPEVEKVTVTSLHGGEEILTLQTLRGRDDGLQLRYSPNNDRSNSARLHGATIGGVVYVFLDDPEQKIDDQVNFYLDGAFERTENYIHWDFKGSGGADPTDPANPWDTQDPLIPNGSHTIKATASLLDGNTVNVTATFDISN